MNLSTEHKALFSLLRAGLWEREPDDLSPFPLTDAQWWEVYRMSVRQTVAGIVFRGLHHLPEEYLPADALMIHWVAKADRIERKNRRMDAALRLLLQRMGREGLHPLLLKGQGVAALYEHPLLRECGDIDLCFPSEKEEREAAELVRRAGCRTERRPDGSVCYSWQGVEVEHHTRLFDLYNPLLGGYLSALVVKHGFTDIRTEDGASLPVPSPLPNLLSLNVHLLKHIMGHGVGLRQFCGARLPRPARELLPRGAGSRLQAYRPAQVERAAPHVPDGTPRAAPRRASLRRHGRAHIPPSAAHRAGRGQLRAVRQDPGQGLPCRLGAEAAHLPLLLEAPRLLRRLRTRGGVLDLDKTHNRKPQMRNEYFFRVAGLLFSVSLPSGWDAEALLPSFRPFRCGACPEGKRIFRLLATTLPFAGGGGCAELLGESSNDMGHVRLLRTPDGYRTEISYGPSAGAAVHVMISDPVFDNAAACLRPEDPYLGEVLSSMLRILYAQAALVRDAVSVHASCVSLEGRGYLFLGRSGTGKSTHARRWLEAFPGCHLLNDDNPVLRVEDGTVTAYGTPWSGKTPCYRNEYAPVAGIVRLQQSPQNRFTPLCGPEAFAALLPSCSAIRRDARLQDALHDTLVRVAGLVPVGRLECLPDTEAARLCLEELNQIIQQ